MNILNIDKYILEIILNYNIKKHIVYFYDDKSHYRFIIDLFYLTCKGFNIQINIKILNLCNTNIKKILYIKNLTHLYLYNCYNINDFTQLHKLINLNELILSYTTITDLSLIPKTIQYLSLEYCHNIFDFSDLSKFINLTYIDLSFTNINNLSILPNNLESIELVYCRNLIDFTYLYKLKKLKKLNLQNVNIYNYNELILNLSNCNIKLI
jgi:hypothetical protein